MAGLQEKIQQIFPGFVVKKEKNRAVIYDNKGRKYVIDKTDDNEIYEKMNSLHKLKCLGSKLNGINEDFED